MDGFSLTQWITLEFLLSSPFALAVVLFLVVQAVKGEFDRLWYHLTRKKPRTRLLSISLAVLFLVGGHFVNGTMTLRTGFMIPVNVFWAVLISTAPFLSQKFKELLQTNNTNQGAS